MRTLFFGLLLSLSALSFSQNYKKGDIVYKISIGSQIKWDSQMELILRQKSLLIRDSNTPNDQFKYTITKKVSLADSATNKYILSSEYGFKGYLLINEPKKEIYLVEDNQNPGYIFILGKEKY